MQQLQRILRQHEKKILSLENVVGLGLGYKTIRGRTTNKPAIIVLVKEKIPDEKLSKNNIIPKTLGDTPTDVIEVGEIRLLAARVEKARPAKPGMSIGHYKITAGTFGALVEDQKTGKPLILSNNHVLANATDGTDGKSAIGDAVLQPGAYDGGTSSDVIAYLERFVPLVKSSGASHCAIANGFEKLINSILKIVKPDYQINFIKRTSSKNMVDAAVASPIKAEYVASEIVGLGEITGIEEPKIGATVQKSGRTTGVTTGQIKAINVVTKVILSPKEEAVFYEQILASPMAKPGDSGSIVVNDEMKAIGLLFAGSNQATLINPITNVLKLLQIKL
ncbi:MAG: hypothetical protein GXW90_05075 [Tepidanaerobacter acetatoxydans]|uniref:hypothetical protein n=1 Tax=Tepidanaerobacter acetatoxydans TaxID=499229 RepID=UPI0026EC9FB0|nr:hypothetical protein [Tepidanaerobacter acetatoxydans]NLU10304.1 hypothetical protein [Tepidanaerobacter acetatoxydans]